MLIERCGMGREHRTALASARSVSLHDGNHEDAGKPASGGDRFAGGSARGASTDERTHLESSGASRQSAAQTGDTSTPPSEGLQPRRNGRPLIYPEEASRIDAKLPVILPALRPEARALVEKKGWLSRRRKCGFPAVRVSSGWCVSSSTRGASYTE